MICIRGTTTLGVEEKRCRELILLGLAKSKLWGGRDAGRAAGPLVDEAVVSPAHMFAHGEGGNDDGSLHRRAVDRLGSELHIHREYRLARLIAGRWPLPIQIIL